MFMTSKDEDTFSSLFCLANGSVSGGNNVLFGIILRLQEREQNAAAFSPFADVQGKPDQITLIQEESFCNALKTSYDFVFLTKPFMIPLALPYLRSSKSALLALDHQEDFDNPSVKSALSLSVPIIVTSKNLQQAIKTSCGRDSYFVPLGIDQALFHPIVLNTKSERKRVLMVGDYLIPLKGMMDGFQAVRKLSSEMDVELVLITQQDKQKQIFDSFDFSVEIHYRPAQEAIPRIYASCDVYMCASWFENFPLPPLEAFSCGIPVVSTRNHGVLDYGVDGTNLLLAEIKDSDDLCQKLKIVLSDSRLAKALVANALTTVKQFDWCRTIDAFVACQQSIKADPPGQTYSEDEMESFLIDLEERGCYTPNAVRRDCRQLFNSIGEQCRNLAKEHPDYEPALNELVRVRDKLKPYLTKSSTLYYHSVKRRYDLCQLLIALRDDTRALRMAASMEVQRT
jgi:glycosyltransferase involved in cell wall biosynthesis